MPGTDSSATQASRLRVHQAEFWSSGTPASVCIPSKAGSQPTPKRLGPKGAQGAAGKQGMGAAAIAVLCAPGSSRLGVGGRRGTCPKSQSASGRAEAGARPAWGIRGGQTPALSLSLALSSAGPCLAHFQALPALRGHFCPLVAKPGASPKAGWESASRTLGSWTPRVGLSSVAGTGSHRHGRGARLIPPSSRMDREGHKPAPRGGEVVGQWPVTAAG